ncbi:YjbN-like Dus1p tRNA dihydouriding synthase Tim barrel [Cryptosporidium ryanae]|uniref:YjbN-like Dus1p tRNA dihydouriding synthase Tim barrel n=1 Tax=Cryptosporidium ryanae TaxID=515981 RepID=UPI00351A8815|nr:YjbN-like Dus1p tRNA dihydouriding synthase Tim barrel [Cryptosporidium ryanae]
MTENNSFKKENVLNTTNLEECIISVAPMLDVTNIHFRTLCRIISKYAELWTEMVVSDTIIHCYKDESRRHLLEDVHLKTNESEDPLVLQLGGNDPDKIRNSILIADKYGFKRYNINVGCPSTKVASDGNFGATLFKYPFRVARIVNEANRTLKELNNDTKLSIKTRIGVDEFDSYKHLFNFISIVSGKNMNNAKKKELLDIFPQDIYNDNELINYDNNNYIGTDSFIIHSRKAWLNGIDPSKNRRIPKLRYSWVYRLTVDFPDLNFYVNGGITSIEQAISILNGSWFIYNNFNNNKNNEDLTETNKKMKLEISDDKKDNNKILDDFSDEDENCKNNYYRGIIRNLINQNKWNRIKGVMIGREVMNNPFITLSNVDQLIYNKKVDNYITRGYVLNKYIDYLKEIRPRNKDNTFTIGELNIYLKPVFGLFYGLSGTKHWRRILTDNISKVKLDVNKYKKPHSILEESIELFKKDYSSLLDIPSSEYLNNKIL